jgi:phytoene dehydrogenase-like protein
MDGSTPIVAERMEEQVERFAPGFRDRILARHVLGPPTRGAQPEPRWR